jgi:hypothetical protein
LPGSLLSQQLYPQVICCRGETLHLGGAEKGYRRALANALQQSFLGNLIFHDVAQGRRLERLAAQLSHPGAFPIRDLNAVNGRNSPGLHKGPYPNSLQNAGCPQSQSAGSAIRPHPLREIPPLDQPNTDSGLTQSGC